MKYPFMVEFNLPRPLPKDFLDLIPANRIATNRLLNKGKFQSYTLAEDRSKLWIVVIAKSELDVLNILTDLPLSEYMFPTIIPLAFHNTTAAWKMPVMSMN